MTQEQIPGNGEAINLPDFCDAIAQQVDIRGNDNKPKPSVYKELPVMSFGTSYDYLEGANGQISFGSRFQTHRMFLDDTELIYVSRPARKGFGTAEFYINQFGDNGMTSRTKFEMHEDGKVHKQRKTAFETVAYGGLIEFSRPLEPHEYAELISVIQDPRANLGYLRILISVNAHEHRMATEAGARYDKQERELEETLHSIDTWRRLGMEAMLRDGTLY